MSGFIKITDIDGNRRLLNVNYIEEVFELNNDESTIYFAFNCHNATEQDNCIVNIPFDELVEMIRNAEVNENQRKEYESNGT